MNSSAYLAHEEGWDVHVGRARVRAHGVLCHLERFGYGIGPAEPHALRILRIAAYEYGAAEVVEGVGCPVEDRERVGAVVGVGVAVEGPVPGVVGVLLLVTVVDLMYIVRLGEDLVPEVDVAGVVDLVEVGRHGVGADQDSSLAHEWFALVEVEEVAEEHVEDEDRVHDGVDVVGSEVRDAQQEHVRLALGGDDHLPVVVLECRGVDGLGGACLYAGHPVGSVYGVRDAPGGFQRHRLRGLVGSEEVGFGEHAPLVLGFRHEIEGGGVGLVIQGALYVEDLDVLVEDSAHPIYGGVHGGFRGIHQGAGVGQRLRGGVMADGGVGGQACMHGLVAPVHGDEVHVHVDEKVALGDATADADLFALVRIAYDYVPVRVLGIVIVEPLRVVAGHDPAPQAMLELGFRHPAVEAKGRDEVDVLYTSGGGFLQHLFDDLLTNVRLAHRWQRYREVVEGDGQLHARR